MIIAGLQRISLIDYPNQISATIFVFGCNFRCGYCHNPELVDIKLKPEEISQKEIFNFLDARQDKLEGITITGGEPTLYDDLPVFLKQIKNKGFLIKLDTNGTNPEMLQQLINRELVDYLAMDIKASSERYSEVVGVEVDLENIKKSIRIIMSSGLDYEFRSTIVPGRHTKEDIQKMAQLVQGANNYYLQNFVYQGKILDSKLKNRIGFSIKDLEEFKKIAGQFVKNCQIR